MKKLVRVATGIKGFDNLVEGGFPEGSVIALVGTPGSGKTIFSLQFLVMGAKIGEKGLYVSFKQPLDSLRIQCSSFGWNIEQMEKDGLIKMLLFDGTNLVDIIEVLNKQIATFKPNRIIIDSMTDMLDYLPSIEMLVKMGVVKQPKIPTILSISPKDVTGRLVSVLIDKMRDTGATVLFVTDAPQQGDNFTKDGITEFACDGVIQLHAIPGEDSFNTLNVLKMRLTKPRRGIFNFEFTNNGLEIKSGG